MHASDKSVLIEKFVFLVPMDFDLRSGIDNPQSSKVVEQQILAHLLGCSIGIGRGADSDVPTESCTKDGYYCS